MTTKITSIAVIFAAAAFFIFTTVANVEMPDTGAEAITARYTYGRSNTSIYMPGCRSYHSPVPPKVIYPAVRKNFVTLPCALEVPPPAGLYGLGR